MKANAVFGPLFAPFARLHRNVRLQTKITVPLLCLLLVSSSIVGGVFYYQAKQVIISQMEARLESETEKIREKIALMKFTFAADEKTYKKRLQYELRQQQAALAQKGLAIQQFMVREGRFEPLENITKQSIDFPAELGIEIQEQRFGVTHVDVGGTVHTLAYTHSPEENFIYVIAVKQEQYLAPLVQTGRFIAFTITASLLLSLMLCWLIVRGITAPFQALIGKMRQVSAGDLTQRTDLDHEGPEIRSIADSFNHMVAQMAEIVNQIKQMITQLNRDGYDIRHAAEEAGERSSLLALRLETVNRGVEETASSTATASSSFQRMKADMDEMLSAITSVLSSGQDMEKVAQHGQERIDELTAMIRRFSQTYEQLDMRMTALHDQSESIGSVVSLIQNIAKQTKMLALNATIEAARAGQYGRGFAVVADEVAKLAGESEKATVEIAKIVRSIQAETYSVSAETTQASEQLQESMTKLSEAENAFLQLRRAIDRTATELEAASSDLSNISRDLGEVDAALETFVAISQETKTSTEEMLHTSREQLSSIEKSRKLANELLAQSGRLHELSNQFHVG
ncbi:methyl-accepting chemotaxis protein [Brevibacillus composti]|uniref:Methyl-accepting chemotaxis protein n=1 Tax=Brevibacillus composti TaxID=2796470 RepID=A0A7T5JP63_9BACL|nr:methyl-accepting chemotaxis protein [Brevibacillus composti]QQE74924.1 methyl-accepting chemotaxis protein [Brevibacillus composti]QUO42009.1 methyl-accepting chemotaxis protein [Brevibacillus composti]